MQRVGRKSGVENLRADLPLRAFFFDCLYANGQVLVEEPNRERWRALCETVPESARFTRVQVSSAEEGERVLRAALDSGNEGVVVKSLASTYDAGRRALSLALFRRFLPRMWQRRGGSPATSPHFLETVLLTGKSLRRGKSRVV